MEAAAGDAARAEEELGDLQLAVVGVARTLGLDAESALRSATTKFARRYEATAAMAEARGLDMAAMTPEALLALYEEARGDGAGEPAAGDAPGLP